MPLVSALQTMGQRPHAGFYMPGHKRGRGASSALLSLLGSMSLQRDLPELPGLDNMLAPTGVLQAAQELAANAFGADRTWFLVNGSTVGIMAALLMTCGRGDRVLVPRTVHRSVISGLILSGAVPVFMTPRYDPGLGLALGVTPETVQAGLQYAPQAVLITSPTYEGVCSDVGAIAALTHAQDIPLIVDEAHGPHLHFHPDLPSSALQSGADLVVQSTHKVLGALTQAAMLHGRGHRVDFQRLAQVLNLLQSTSPSYLLLASLDAARQQMALHGAALLSEVWRMVAGARSQISDLPGLLVLTPDHLAAHGMTLDPTRLTVDVSGLGLDGFTADQLLDQTLGIIAELPTLRHLTFVPSFGNTAAEVQQLVQGLQTLAASPSQKQLNWTEGLGFLDLSVAPDLSLPALSPQEAWWGATEAVPWEAAVGRISAELVCPYPPGIPTLLPGEQITAQALAFLQRVQAQGGDISGCADPTLQFLQCLQGEGGSSCDRSYPEVENAVS
ncbi:aminotransferase class I/II-fold pyridoxal phosphate-dependent enzyme [Synechococcales cyanobacterium C]|uniref:Aminotransferase class I/II-fold pyridoxal phosphate-dependent enzyme n=1 Tax=Petrachloros mirabilis ULC683 TaxID=2781853 RepID=A0A8K2A8E9_9CYAN|nr:aminotransferase class I/II-fold pyridoxal phosphate-dependent enzyme [Petrachloros mirabilis]NCJ07954.1 aminotransferase class I/II-fold pyridoxal phosphate-dependent enzyme [Petrachloros mirabilis ULC683]